MEAKLSGRHIVFSLGWILLEAVQSTNKDTTEYLDGAAIASERRMSKGMFYLYGGPALGRTIEMTDGSSVNLKAVMDQAGCTSNSHYYTITHYVLSYFYLK